VELAKPVIHYVFVPYIADALKATCRVCGKVKLPEDEIDAYLDLYEKLEKKWPLHAKRVIAYVKKKAAKVQQCPHCGAKQYKIRLEKPYKFLEERQTMVVQLTPADV
jgi:DNA-directed RNA polymerase subunit A'